MIYNNLRDLPILIYSEALNTGDTSLLVKDEPIPDNINEVWEELQSLFIEKDNEYLSNKVVSLIKYYNSYLLKYHLAINLSDLLLIEFDETNVAKLKKLGFKVSKGSYIEDLETVKKNSEGLLIKAKHFKSQLPKPDKAEDKDNASIEDVLASFSNILGFSIGDFNKISCMAYFGYKMQVKEKIKQQEAQLRELKRLKK